MYIQGKNFMFYVECKTLTGDVMLPLCSAESVQLGQQSRLREVSGDNDSKSSRWAYGILDNTLDIDGLITYSADQIQSIIVEVNNALLETNNALVSVGGVPVNDLSPYFCFENALNEWKYLNWYCEDQNNPGFKYKGVVLVAQIQNSWTPNDKRKFSCSLQIDGDLERFHTPPPTSLKKTGQSNTLPTEDASYLSIAPVQQGNTWLSGVTLTGNPLPNGVFTLNLGGTSIGGYAVRIGDTLESIALNIATLISDKVLRAYVDGDTVYIETSTSQTLTAPYTNHTGVLRSVYMSFQSKPYDFYRFKVEQNGHTWFVDTQGTNPTLILPTGSYEVSVAGMGTDLQYSDYSETIQITVS